jgi:ATP-dependent protease ClpP protease subunit
MFYNKQTELIKKLIISKSKITEEEYINKQRTEWYLMASEAKEKGITDFIIGEDCDIDMVV